MKTNEEKLACDLVIIGTGMAGMSAALFAARQNIDTVQVGSTSGLVFASGLMDLFGVHPLAGGQVVENPWDGIRRLCRDEPRHPYARLEPSSIREAMETILTFFKQNAYPHATRAQSNITTITPVGTLKPTYAVPHTMSCGPRALADRKACLLVDFKELKGYSATQIAHSLTPHWPELNPVRIDFPDMEGELYTERIGRAMDSAKTREKLVAAIHPHLNSAEAVGFPAVLGIYRTVEVMQDMQQGLGVPVFEIPTMLPAITGLRLQNTFEQNLPQLGIRCLYQERVRDVHRLADGSWSLETGTQEIKHRIKARCVVLCSGRFLSRGMHADRQGIRETIFNLPVSQPTQRSQWHQKDFFNRMGHPVNRAGLEVDDSFRPVDEGGQAIYENLFAAGIVLAHQDWTRQKCGSGLAVATAYGAVKSCSAFLKAKAKPFLKH